MPTQENAAASQETAGARAAGALRGVASAQAAARLHARLLPGWYGPAVAASLILPAFARAWSEGRGGWAAPLALAVSLAGLAVVVGLIDAARRRAAVRVRETWPARLRRAAGPLLLLAAAALVTYAVCLVTATGRAATESAVFTVLGLGAWAEFAVRNRALRGRLRQGNGAHSGTGHRHRHRHREHG